MIGFLFIVGVIAYIVIATLIDDGGGGGAGSSPRFDTALLTGRGEVGLINLYDRITDDCLREGIHGSLPSGTLVGVTLVRSDCNPKMYFIGTGAEGENGWVSELFLDPR